MEDLPLIWLLPVATFVLVIVFALWSKRRTENASAEKTSPLARSEPDPQFQPDSKVTDPHDVTRS